MSLRVRLLLLPFAASVALLAADSAAPRVIQLKAGVDNAVKFDVPAITAAPGETIKIVLTNASTLPKAVMGHNWILLAKGTDPVAFSNAGVNEGENHIAASMKEKVLASIPTLGPGEKGEITFTAPTETGDYTFLCSFPAHCQIGMKGTLTVKK